MCVWPFAFSTVEFTEWKPIKNENRNGLDGFLRNIGLGRELLLLPYNSFNGASKKKMFKIDCSCIFGNCKCFELRRFYKCWWIWIIYYGHRSWLHTNSIHLSIQPSVATLWILFFILWTFWQSQTFDGGRYVSQIHFSFISDSKILKDFSFGGCIKSPVFAVNQMLQRLNHEMRIMKMKRFNQIKVIDKWNI